MSDLSRVHAKMYNMNIEDSQEILISVFNAIEECLMDCDALMIPNFGKFQHQKLDSYIMADNRPGQGGVKKKVAARYRIKFTPSEAFNDVAVKYHRKMAARGEE